MLKIKSKAILALAGLMVAAFVLAGTASADMVTLPAGGVHKSDSVSTVQSLQTFLNWNLGAQITPLAVDGVYGAKTTAAIKLFQSNNGLTADGVFGKMSAAKAMALQANAGGVTYPAGCASNSGYSSTTGMSCAGGALPAGCSSSAGYSSTTGIACNSQVGGTLPAGCATAAGFSTTTGMSCSGGTVSTGTNGYLTTPISDSTNRVSTVYESEQDRVVAGFSTIAKLSSQTVNRVRVTFRNTDTSGSSVNFANYASGVSLWYGSTKLATMAIAQADRSNTDDTYTFNFSGISAMIAQDQTAHFYVSVSVNGSIDTNNSTDDWTVAFPDGGLQAVSPDGSTDTYNASAGNVTGTDASTGLGFGKFAANGVKATVGISQLNPASGVVTVQTTGATNGVTLLNFTIKATNAALRIRRIPVQVVSSSGDVSAKINTLHLMKGGVEIASLSGSNAFTVAGSITSTPAPTGTTVGFLFNNFSAPNDSIAIGTTAEFSIVADLKQVSGNYTEGQTLTTSVQNLDVVSVANFSVEANGDQLGTSYRFGSAVGNTMSLYANGLSVSQGAANTSTVVAGTSANDDVATFTINFNVTAGNSDIYIPANAVSGQSGTATAGKGYIVFDTVNSAGTPVASTGVISSNTTSGSDSAGNSYFVPSSSTRSFTLTVNRGAMTAGLYRALLTDVRWGTTAAQVLTSSSTAASYTFNLANYAAPWTSTN